LNRFGCASAPTPAQAAELKKNFHGQCGRAAKAIFESDVLLVVTGAGFSADSGLAVYADVARIPAYAQRGLDYSDICDPDHLHSEPELFYGFWGQCFNDYRRTGPHRGYEIIARWRDDKQRGDGGGGDRSADGDVAGRIRTRIGKISFMHMTPTKYWRNPSKRQDIHAGDEEPPAGAFHLFTSNVDAHSYDYFRAGEIYECHGNIELWQCSSSALDGSGCPSTIWRAPLRHEFLVDPHTMLAPRRRAGAGNVGHDATPETEEGGGARLGQTTGTRKRDTERLLRHMPASIDAKGWQQVEGENWPTCGHCDAPARPAVLMFGDTNFKCDEDQLRRWELWRRAVPDVVCRDTGGGGRVCVLEIGCGVRVPTCRFTSEEMVDELAARGGVGRTTFVRINPDFPLAALVGEDDGRCEVIPIMSTGLAAIEQIDELYREIANGKLPDDGDRKGTVQERIWKIPDSTEIDQLSSPLEKLRLSETRQIV